MRTNSACSCAGDSHPRLRASVIIRVRTDGFVGVARELEVTLARRTGRRAIAASAAAASGREPLRRPERGRVALEVIEEHPHFGHVAPQQLVDEGDLLRIREPVVREVADVAAEARVRVASVRPAVTVIELGANRPTQLRAYACPLPISPAGADWK